MTRSWRRMLVPWALPALAAGVAAAQDGPSAVNALVVGPYLQRCLTVAPEGSGRPAAQVAIKWETERPCVGLVRYDTSHAARLAAGALGLSAREGQAAAIHEVRLAGLEPGTEYGYAIEWDGQTGPLCAFRTPPAPGTPRFRLVVYGDSRSNPDVHGRIAKLILDQQPDAVLHTGDLVASGREKPLWAQQYFEPTRDLGSRVCIWPTPGNHEGEAHWYYDYFSLPPPESWYSFDFANAHIISLDSCLPTAPGTPQYQWLEQDLRQAGDGWVLAFLHHPLFGVHPTRDAPQTRWDLHPLFTATSGGTRHVDLALAGHDHYYARSRPIGWGSDPASLPTTYLVAGGGGASLYPVAERPWSACASSTYSIVVLDFGGDVLRGRTLDMEGREIDRFELRRGVRPPADEIHGYEMLELEHSLQGAARKAPVTELGPTGGSAAYELTAPSPFRRPAELAASWDLGGSPWRAEPPQWPFALKPGAAVTLPIHARVAAGEDPLPVPKLSLRLVAGDFDLGFLGREFSFLPIRFKLPTDLVVRQALRPPRVDGIGDDDVWRDAAEVSRLLLPDGRDDPQRTTICRLAYDRDTLYLLGQMTAEGSALQGGATAADDRSIHTRDDSLGLVVFGAEGAPAYFLATNPAGAKWDSRDGDRTWSCDWSVEVARTPEGWTAEAAVPLTALEGVEPPLPGVAWRVNVYRHDAAAQEASWWAPPFADEPSPESAGTWRFH